MDAHEALGCFQPVPFTQVRIADQFWTPRLAVNRERTIAAEYRQCKETGRIDAFRLDWRPGQEPVPHIFWDSDVAKWIEAASYTLATHPDPQLDALVDEVIDLVVSAQQPDGYLNVHFAVVEPGKRWTNLRDCHELYCAGHLIEAAVAHYQATGKRRLLEALCRYADLIDATFGTAPGKKRGYCGHEEIELALVKLYRATGQERYLRLAQYLVEERGRQPHYYQLEAAERQEKPGTSWYGRQFFDDRYAYFQAHVPVREQTEAVGHSVRVMYLFSAVADLAGELGDRDLLAVCQRVWDDLVLKKMYVTGGIGSSERNEGFTAPYDLPNREAYAETCAAVGLVMWAHRLVQLTGDGRYADIMERALYNGVISGVSLDGERFFYVNPLASDGSHHRQGWFSCACCPPNLARLLASLGQYAYSTSADGLAVHLYIGGEVKATLADGSALSLGVDTRYPWEGSVRLALDLEKPTPFTLWLRVPGWSTGCVLRVNGQAVEPGGLRRGYISLRREWREGDRVEVEFPMDIQRMEAHPAVLQDRGCVAIQRGPIVYCAEGVDQQVEVGRLALPAEAGLRARFEPQLLGGVVVLEGEGVAMDEPSWQGQLYRPYRRADGRPTPLRLIPYCTWDNRAPGSMAVWLPRWA